MLSRKFWWHRSPPSRATSRRCAVRGPERFEQKDLLSAVAAVLASNPIEQAWAAPMAWSDGGKAGGSGAGNSGGSGGGGAATTGGYTYETMKLQLLNWAATYSDICQVVRIGQGAEKYADPIANDPRPETTRGLWAIKISDHVQLENDTLLGSDTVVEYEPDLKYIGTMHGNEPLGMEMNMRFIHELLTNYDPDNETAITKLVDHNEIWVLPLMNPDGFAHNQRGNVNGYDLNRSFPELAPLDPYALSKPALAALEAQLPRDKRGNCLVPEVYAVMEWNSQHDFVLAANFHTGNLGVNYPYDNDGTSTVSHYATAPDDALFKSLATRYASNNGYMTQYSPFVTDGVHGITNGAAWFVVAGGMQDFDYRYFGTFHVTVELYPGYGYGTKKDPINLDQQWDLNRAAMLAYLEEGVQLVNGYHVPQATLAAADALVGTSAAPFDQHTLTTAFDSAGDTGHGSAVLLDAHDRSGTAPAGQTDLSGRWSDPIPLGTANLADATGVPSWGLDSTFDSMGPLATTLGTKLLPAKAKASG